MVKLWKFSGIDTLFFRDSTPFNAGEGGQADVQGLFPPYMTTLQGAIRTTLAYNQGWRPGSDLPTELGGPDDLGQLKLKGPYVLANGEPLFPAPKLLLQSSNKKGNYVRLKPGPEVKCDLGDNIKLPIPQKDEPGLKLLEKSWLTLSGMETVLVGNVPKNFQVLAANKLWGSENRVGIKLCKRSGTAEDSMLYSSIHVRLKKGITLGVLVEGVPDSWYVGLNNIIPLGGEGKMAGLTIKDEIPAFPGAPEIKSMNSEIRYTVTLITPGYYKNIENVIRNGPPDLPGKCVSACIDKLEQVGGWDLKDRSPRPLQPLVPAGSTWFFTADEAEKQEIYDLHGKCIGDKTEYGFGQILIGIWGD